MPAVCKNHMSLYLFLRLMIVKWLTDSEGDAGEGGGGVDGAAEQGLDVVSLGCVLAPAEVRAGLCNVISDPDIPHVPPRVSPRVSPGPGSREGGLGPPPCSSQYSESLPHTPSG